MTNANLKDATFNAANLRGANMKGANITGLKFDERTVWPDGKVGSQGSPADYIV